MSSEPDRPDQPPASALADGAVARRQGEHSFDPGLQAERTSLAWERTGFAIMAAGVLFGRYAVAGGPKALAAGGIAQLVLGAAVLIWSGFRYRGLQAPLWADEPVVHPTAARVVGLATIVFIALALGLTVLRTAGLIA